MVRGNANRGAVYRETNTADINMVKYRFCHYVTFYDFVFKICLLFFRNSSVSPFPLSLPPSTHPLVSPSLPVIHRGRKKRVLVFFAITLETSN